MALPETPEFLELRGPLLTSYSFGITLFIGVGRRGLCSCSTGLGFGIIVLVILGATGLLMGAVCRSVMHVNDECEPIGHGRKETKAIYRFSPRQQIQDQVIR